jgi:outer membrane protein
MNVYTPSRIGLAAALLAIAAMAPLAHAQQRIAYVDSEYILERVPEYQTAQQQVDRQAQQWQAELDEAAAEILELERDFAAREILYTDDERERRRTDITDRRRAKDALRLRYFGPEGELFREQTRLMRPVQERILEAIEEVARDGNYDFVFDRSGDYLFLYARPQLDVSDRVLEELGIDAARAPGR